MTVHTHWRLGLRVGIAVVLGCATSVFAAGSKTTRAAHAPAAAGVTQQQVLDALLQGRDAAGPTAAWREQHAPMASALRATNAEPNAATELDGALRELDAAIDRVRSADVGAAQATHVLDLADRVSAARFLTQDHLRTVGEKLDRLGASNAVHLRLQAAQTLLEQRLSTLESALVELAPQLQSVAKSQPLGFIDATLLRVRAVSVRDALLQFRDSAPVRALGVNPLPQSRPLLAPLPPPTTPAIQPSYATSDHDVVPTPDDRASSADAPFAPSILAQAQSLGYDYARIFDLVRSSIDTQWYAGAQKGAEETLRTGAGNDVDQASLLIALLRASGAPARFVHGTVEVPVTQLQSMLGVGNANDVGRALTRAGIASAPVIAAGHVTAYRIEHTWVSARVPFGNYRGTTVDTSSTTWIPLDTAIKPYAYRPLAAALKTTPIDRSALWHAYSQQQQTELPLARLQRELQDYLNGLSGTPGLDTLTAKRQLNAPALGLLPASLPFTVVAATDEAAKLAVAQIQTVEIDVYDGTGANAVLVLGTTVPVRDLLNRRVTLSYIPATVDDHNVVLGFGGLGAVPPYLVHVRPRISVAGRELVSGSGDLALAVPHRISIHVKNAAGQLDFDQTLISGGYTALVLDAQGAAPQPQADNSALNGDSEQLAAQLLSNLGMRYSGAWDDAENAFGATLGVALVRPFPSLLLVNNEISVQTTAGLATSLNWKGVSLDAALRAVEPLSDSGRVTDESDWFGLASTQGSVLEHSVFEQQWSVDSISADKGLALAGAQGIAIVELQSGGNTSGLSHPADVIALVQSWLDRGMQVEIPQRQITVHAWTGSVWRVQDPASGANGYFISGNWAGGTTDEAGADWEVQFLAEALSDPYTAQPNNDPTAALRIRKLAATDYQIGTVGKQLERPLEVFVSDDSGRAVKGAAVTFVLSAGGSDAQLLDNATGGALSGPAITDVHGLARVRLKLGTSTRDNTAIALLAPTDQSSTRVGVHSVDASVIGKDGPHQLNGPFTELAKPDVAIALTIDDAPTRGIPGLYVGSIQAELSDQYSNPVANQPITFAAAGFDTTCSPQARNALVYVNNDCDPSISPVLGSCGVPSATTTSGIDAAIAGVYLGDGLQATYHIVVSSPGTPSRDLPITDQTAYGCVDPNPSPQPTSPAATLFAAITVNKHGELIEAASPLKSLGSPRREMALFAPFVANHTLAWAPPLRSDPATAEATNGASVDGVSSPGPGVFDISLRGAAQPGYHALKLTLGNTYLGLPTDPLPPIEFTSTGFFTAQANISKLDPPALTLQPDGTATQAITADVQIAPDGYHPEVTGMLLQDGTPVFYALADTDAATRTAKLNFPRTIQFDPHKTYAIEAALSYGDPFEIRAGAAPTPLPVAQGLFYDVDPKIRLSQYLDIPNKYVCDHGANFRFSIAQDANVTLKFFALGPDGSPSPIATTMLDNAAFTAGDQSVSIRPEDLGDGTYQYVLSGVVGSSGQTDSVKGVAAVEFRQFNSLPIGHPLVQGVDLFDGHVTVAREDFALGGRGPGLRFARTYASSNTEIGALGRGWSINYSSQIIITPCNEYIVTGSEGQGMRFLPSGSGATQTFTPTAGYHGSLTQAADGSFDFYAVDGTRYHYSGHSVGNTWLDYIEDTNANRVIVTYPLDAIKPYPATVSDAAGRSLTFVYDPETVGGTDAHEQRLRQVKGPNGLQLDFDYAADNYLSYARRSGASGGGQRYEHFVYRVDAQHPYATQPLTQVQDVIGGGAWQYAYDTVTMSVLAPGGQTITFPGNNVIGVTAPDNGVTTLTYTGAIGVGQPLTRTVKDGVGGLTTYQLNDYGAPESVVDPAGTTTMHWNGTHIEPDSRTDKNGTTTIYTYDQFGNKASESITGPNGAINRSWTYYLPTAFTPPYIIKNRVQTYTDARAIDTNYAYDLRGNLTDATRDGVTLHSDYLANGDRSTSVDGRHFSTTYHFDAFGYPSDASDSIGSLGGTVYDALGRKTQQSDGEGHVSTYDYDALDRVTAIHYPATPAGSGSKTIAYADAARTRSDTDELGHATVTTYDAMGRVLSVENAKNDTKFYTYDYNGNRLTELDFAGKQTTNVYDAANRLTDKHEPETRDTHYDYDYMGHVTRQTVGSGAGARVTEYAYQTPEYHRTLVRRISETGVAEDTALYDGNGNAYETHDALGRKTTRVFDNRDRLTELDEPEGKITTYGYDDDDDRTSETLNLVPARTRTWEYDARKRESERIAGDGGKWDTGYDLADQVTSRTDPLSHTVTYVPDARHSLLSQSGPEAGMVTTYAYDLAANRTKETWANTEVIQHEYDELNRLKHSYDSIGDLTKKTYDANGNLETETDANGNLATHHYDGLNRKVQSDLPESRTLKWTYNVHGDVVTQADANNHTTTNVYDLLGHRIETDTELTIQKWTYDVVGNVLSTIDPNNYTTTWTYDDLNRKKTQTDPPTPGVGVQQWTYDAAGNVLTQIDRRGIESDVDYDAENRPLHHKRDHLVLDTRAYDLAGNLHTLQDANNNLTTYLYDKANRKTDDLRPLNAVTHTTFYPIGDVNTVTDADGNVTTYTYDLRRHLATERNGEAETTVYAVDGNGNRTSTQRPLGAGTTWIYKYDHANRLKEVDDPLHHATTYAYDNNGNLTTQTDANLHVTTFEYDALNRRTKKTWPPTSDGTAFETYTPDGNGNITDRVDANGQHIQYTFDALNREILRTYSAATGGDIASETRTPDGNGNVTSIRQLGADGQPYATTRNYDHFDRLSDETDRYGNKLTFVYDLNGNRIQRIDSAGTTTYTPDALNRITDVTPPNANTAHTDYFPSGRVHTVTTGQLVSTTEYDRAGRILTLAHQQNSATVANYAYTYDLNGNRKEQYETNGSSTEKTTYVYDTADRLTDTTYPNLVAHYDLDNVGNRYQETLTDPTTHATLRQTNATFNARDQITRLDDGAAPIQYTYDLNGNLSKKTQNGHDDQYRTNAQDRLATLTLQGAPPADYLYDASGLRISKSTAGSTTHYRYDQQALIQETNTLNNLLARYDYTQDRQLAEVRSGSTNYFLHDALKSPIAQITAQGAIAMRAQYDAWGQLRSESGTNTQAFGFTGYQRDRESGLYYAKARYYDPSIARFQSEDPELGKPMQPPSLHRYLYAYGNPTVYVDASGRNSEELQGAADLISGTQDYLDERVKELPQNGLGTTISAGVGLGQFFLGATKSALRVVDAVDDAVKVGVAAAGGRVDESDLAGAKKGLGNSADFVARAANYLVNGGPLRTIGELNDTATQAENGNNLAMSRLSSFGGGFLAGSAEFDAIAATTASENAAARFVTRARADAPVSPAPPTEPQLAMEGRTRGVEAAQQPLQDAGVPTQVPLAASSVPSKNSVVVGGPYIELGSTDAIAAKRVYQQSHNSQEPLVIGRQPDTEAGSQLGMRRLNDPDWKPNFFVNDAWMQGGVDAGKPFYLGSNISFKTLRSGNPLYPKTVFFRELKQLRDAGYHREGDWMLPPIP